MACGGLVTVIAKLNLGCEDGNLAEEQHLYLKLTGNPKLSLAGNTKLGLTLGL